jgi:hypothetical protein
MTAAHRRRRCLYLTELPKDVSLKCAKRIKSVSSVFRPSVYEWLTRELQAVLQHNDVNLLVQHVMGSLERNLNARCNTDQSRETVDSIVFNLVMEAVESVLVQLNRRHGAKWARILAAEFVACGLTVAAYDEALSIQETALIE